MNQLLIAERPLTSFILQPDALSWIVGFLAGVAGVLALTSAKSGALVGVLISVTTVPAAANSAVALAYWVPSKDRFQRPTTNQARLHHISWRSDIPHLAGSTESAGSCLTLLPPLKTRLRAPIDPIRRMPRRFGRLWGEKDPGIVTYGPGVGPRDATLPIRAQPCVLQHKILNLTRENDPVGACAPKEGAQVVPQADRPKTRGPCPALPILALR
jgi:hypothetical protein